MVPTTAARARLGIESQLPSVCSTGRSIATVRGATLFCRCAAIEVGSVAALDAVMPGEFPRQPGDPACWSLLERANAIHELECLTTFLLSDVLPYMTGHRANWTQS